MRRLALVIALSSSVLWGCTTTPPNAPPTTTPGGTSEPTQSTAKPAPGVFSLTRITPQQVQARIAQGENMVLADVRGRASYDLLHIAGAISLPAADYQVWGPTLSRDQTIVLYCA